ncbi:DUF222 domain-containing protein [Arthrobacter sp. ATA002]|uniref:HNH endonuclease signature motif containing protein n=1 Tax=Arthrobacter sp. ATA002 TaxID=2991715 RepID=UPI0022A72A43|nr:HNH endonuclease signature motif containing protein [Arthrobacter sp. ATA002]WAP50462.1 DUF222 domain-containing protein [Arthrobacter sp. ATA002]
MDQNGSFPGTDNGQAAAGSLSVFVARPSVPGTLPDVEPRGADPAGRNTNPLGSEVTPVCSELTPEGSELETEGSSSRDADTVYPDGLTGSLALRSVEVLNEEESGSVLSRLNHLARWVQAQQAKVLNRMQNIYENESMFVSGLPDSGMAFSLAAEEAAAILGVPTGTGKALMSEAGDLCTSNTATLESLEAGGISYGHVSTVLEQCVGIDPAEVQSFETELLGLAAGQTKAQFRVRAQRLRENKYPETIVERQRTAFDQRRVWLRPEPDGMSWLSAILPAETAQGIFNQLTTAARGEQAAGDPRSVDQLRTDILTDHLGGHSHSDCHCDNGDARKSRSRRTGHSRGNGRANSGSGAGRDGAGRDGAGRDAAGMDGAGRGSCRIGHGPRARTEIVVIINAETLFGADDQPAELLGCGPISPERARRMARTAVKWTPVERNPDGDEILRVGRSRRVSTGLKRFLRARDGTCRFPGCRINAVISEIDHTKPWAQGGATDHDNLEHLCRRHHMFKTEGYWKAHQPSPGIIEWTSPGGRRYCTEPDLTLVRNTKGPDPALDPSNHQGGTASPLKATVADDDGSNPADPDDYGDDPPPF